MQLTLGVGGAGVSKVQDSPFIKNIWYHTIGLGHLTTIHTHVQDLIFYLAIPMSGHHGVEKGGGWDGTVIGAGKKRLEE